MLIKPLAFALRAVCLTIIHLSPLEFALVSGYSLGPGSIKADPILNILGSSAVKFRSSEKPYVNPDNSSGAFRHVTRSPKGRSYE